MRWSLNITNGSCVYREQVELCVEILERILLALSPVSLAQNYRVELQGGLTHPNETVKILALTQVGFPHTPVTRTHIYTITFKLTLPSFSVRLVEFWSTRMLPLKSSTTMTFLDQ